VIDGKPQYVNLYGKVRAYALSSERSGEKGDDGAPPEKGRERVARRPVGLCSFTDRERGLERPHPT
jgi:hypothetical protein